MPRSFPPVAGRRAKVLILGSMPGAESLRRRRYYAHPRNAFWRLLGAALGTDLESLTYPRRLTAMKRRGVALWDTVAECEREGSLDSAVRRERPNPVGRLAAKLGVRAVFLNGGLAARMFRRHALKGLPAGTAVVVLPSSSPAAAGVPEAVKRRRWSAIARHL